MAAGAALRQVFVRLGFEVEDSGLQRADKVFNSFLAKVASAAFVFKSVKGAMQLLSEQIKAGTEIKLLADEFQMSTLEIQKFKFAAEQVGLSTKEMVSAMTTLSNHMGMTTTLTGIQHSIKLFGQYGLSVRDAQGKMKDFPTMLGDVADKMKTMDNAAQRVRMADELLGRQAGGKLIPLLMQGSGAIKEMFGAFDQLNLAMSDKFVQSSFVVGQKVKVLKQAFNVFKSEIALGAYPWLKLLVDKLTHLVSWGTKVARATTGMASGWRFFGLTLLSVIVKLAGGLRSLFTLFLRFMWPIVIFGLLYLLFDDLYALLNGYPSLIGLILDRFLGHKKAQELIDQLKGAWEMLKASLNEALPAIKEIGKALLSFLPDAIKFTAKLVELLAGLVDKLASGKSAFSAAFGNLLMANDDYNARVEGYMRDGDTESMAKTKALGHWLDDVHRHDQDYLATQGKTDALNPLFSNPFASSPQAPGGAKSIGSVNVNNNFEVKVEGGPNAGKDLVNGAERALKGSDLNDAASQAGLHGGM